MISGLLSSREVGSSHRFLQLLDVGSLSVDSFLNLGLDSENFFFFHNLGNLYVFFNWDFDSSVYALSDDILLDLLVELRLVYFLGQLN